MILPPPGFMQPNPQPVFDFGIAKIGMRPEMTTTPEFGYVQFVCGCGMYVERNDEHGVWYPPAELTMKRCGSLDHGRWWRDFWDWKHDRRKGCKVEIFEVTK